MAVLLVYGILTLNLLQMPEVILIVSVLILKVMDFTFVNVILSNTLKENCHLEE